jgi:hypothetical protein
MIDRNYVYNDSVVRVPRFLLSDKINTSKI